MYLLLIFYSITNLNVVSWGTREVAVKKTKKELAEEKKTQENAVKKSKKDGIWGLLMNGSDEDEEGGVDFALGNVLRLMLFTKKKENSQERQQLIRIADSLDNLGKRLDHIEGVIDPHTSKQRRKSSRMSARGDFTNVVNPSESGDTMDLDSEGDKSESTEPKEERDDLINPYWIEDRDLGRGEVDHLSGVEIQFWKDLIDKYLSPIDADKKREAVVLAGLTELRNKAVFFFSVFNALFVLIVFMLTLHKDTLHIDWPFGVKENITITEDEQVIITTLV
jgi:chitin synthase